MARSQIFESRSYAPLLDDAGRLVREHAAVGEVVVLAPTRAAADEFMREHAGAGVLGVHRFTPAQFAAALAGPMAGDRQLAMIGHLSSEALAARVVYDLQRAGKLSYFSPVAATPGFARILAATILEMRLEQVAPEALTKAGVPCQDLAGLCAAYARELQARSLADLPVLFELAAEAARVGSHRLLGVPVVCLDVKADRRVERAFLDAVAERSSAMTEFRLSQPSSGECETALDQARHWVFSLNRPPARPKDDSVAFFSAAGEGLEAIEVARRILQLAADGTPFDRMAILLRDPDRYQTLIEEALRRAAIPAYFSRGASRPDPAGRAFLALLACASEGCSASRFAEYLSLGQVPSDPGNAEWQASTDEVLGALDAPPEPTEESDDAGLNAPAGWEKLLVDAAVIGGSDRWRRRLQGLEHEFRLKLKAAAIDDEAERQRMESRIEQLRNLESFALPLIDRMNGWPQQASWGQWLKHLGELAEAALQHPASVLSTLTDLEPMDEVGAVGLEEVYGVLEDRLRFFRREPDPRRYGSVFVCSIEEARGRHFAAVFLPGLAEGMFPRRAFENPLLLDQYRIALKHSLKLQDDRAADERRLLLNALAVADRQLVVSYPSMDTTLSRPRVPSFYALEILRAIEGALPDLATFQKRSAGAAQTRLSWPAPADPQAAVDNAEYDLASLKLTLDGGAQKGAARYLVDVSENLKRSLRARGRRWRGGWFAEDGLVVTDEGLTAALAQHRLRIRTYSPSALQNFAQCPYRFALQSIYGLRPREDAVALDQLDPLTRGEIFHAAQFELFRHLQANDLLPVGMARLDDIFDAADAVLDRVAADYKERLAPAIERVWITEIEDVRTDLRAWLREVAANGADWAPSRFEYGFGLDQQRSGGHDPASSKEPAVILDGFRVRGSMDLVEEHRQTKALRVVDHKTGKMPDRQPLAVGGGEFLQPLLYALAGENLWNRPVESGSLYYCTQRGGYKRIDIYVTGNGRRHLAQVLSTIDDAIERVFLPAAPAKDACKRCDYTSVCGPYEADRSRRKNQDSLEPLQLLRELP